jgi:hypothetical protein
MAAPVSFSRWLAEAALQRFGRLKIMKVTAACET